MHVIKSIAPFYTISTIAPMLVEEAPPGFGVPLETAGKDRHGPGCRGAGVQGCEGWVGAGDE